MRPSRTERVCCDRCRRLTTPGKMFALKSGVLCERCTAKSCILFVKSARWIVGDEAHQVML